MEEELLAAEILEIGVLHPAGTQFLVREIEGELEDRQSRHQPRRKRRHAGAVAVDLAALRLDRTPRHGLRKLHQLMLQVDDLVEPRAEQILLSALTAIPWLHGESPRPIP